MDTVEHIRQHSGWIHENIFSQHVEITYTHLQVDEEYWLALKHPSEVASVGMAMLETTYPGFSGLTTSQQDAIWREFRAYVRQADGFYRAACVLPWKSSPLNYYYSFMNLAKAMCVASGNLPLKLAQEPRKMKHGLSAKVVTGTSDIWNLNVHDPDDIFPRLYNFAIGTNIAKHTAMDARKLLNYVSTIAWQLNKSGGGPKYWFQCYWVILTTPSEYWDVLVVPRAAELDQLPPTFASEYNEVTLEGAKSFALQVLGFRAQMANGARFLERKTPIPVSTSGTYNIATLRESLKTAARHFVFDHVTNSKYQLSLGMPYGTGPGIPMNEFVASYSIMFFLSTLVRYHPDYLDHISESSESWLIESFTKSAPLLILRYLAAGVLGYPLVIESTQ